MNYIEEMNKAFQLIDFSNYPDDLPDRDDWKNAMQKILQKMPVGYEFKDASDEYHYKKIADDIIEVVIGEIFLDCFIGYSSRDIYSFLTGGLEVDWEEAESEEEIPSIDTWKEYIASFVEDDRKYLSLLEKIAETHYTKEKTWRI